MNKTLLAGLALGTATILSGSAFAQSSQQIHVAGSSTVLPYAQIVAENFGETFPDYQTPIVESGGSSAGLKQFCQGVGPDTIDIANASRSIRDSEIKACADAGVTEISEVKFGYDGIVFASSASGPSFALKPAMIFRRHGRQGRQGRQGRRQRHTSPGRTSTLRFRTRRSPPSFRLPTTAPAKSSRRRS